METKARIGDREDRLDELTFEPVSELEPGRATGITPESLGPREPMRTIAADTTRSKSYLASEAIASYIDRNAWQIEEIKRGLDEARSGKPGIPHDEVEKWVRSWGSDHELPRPTARNA